MKTVILKVIYDHFAKWAASYHFYCHSGCSTCCTAMVTVTALEGRQILEYCHDNDMMSLLTDKLVIDDDHQPPAQTTNEFIAISLNGGEEVQPPRYHNIPCLFLDNGMCTIYEVRPFSCRCFASNRPCHEQQTATVSDDYLCGSTVALQLIEHLGQFDHWGNLRDILLLESLKKDSCPDNHLKRKRLMVQLMPRVRRAHPIPGFIIPKECHEKVSSLLSAILSSRIEKHTIEEIFNGRGRENDIGKTSLGKQ